MLSIIKFKKINPQAIESPNYLFLQIVDNKKENY